jgi:hypothetical protein
MGRTCCLHLHCQLDMCASSVPLVHSIAKSCISHAQGMLHDSIPDLTSCRHSEVGLAQHVLDGHCPALQIEGSRRNIEEHYDAGNAMYKLFLDDTMTYSSGIHRPGGTPCSAHEPSHVFARCAANSTYEDTLGRASHALDKQNANDHCSVQGTP